MKLSSLIGGTAIVLGSFFGTLFALDYYESRSDPMAAEKASLMAALRDHRKALGAYPILPNQPTADLKKELVRLGHLHPDSRPEPDKDSRYVSFDGKSYGFLFHIDKTAANPLGTPCVVEVDAVPYTGWWGQPQKCPF